MRGDVLLVHLPRQRKTASKMPDRIFRVEGFEPVVVCGFDAALDTEHLVLDFNVYGFLRHAGHLHNDCQCVCGFENIRRRHVKTGGNRFFLLRCDFFLLLYLKFLSSHGYLHYAILMARGLSCSARGKNIASMPSRYSALILSASISTGRFRD